MSKEPARLLPYLTRSEVEERDRLESTLYRDLSSCTSTHDIDEERAEHIMHAAAVSIFDVEYNAYRKKPGYEPKWILQIINESLLRVLKAADNIYWPDLPALFNGLTKTVTHHAQQIPQKIAVTSSEHTKPQVFVPTGQRAAAYARAGVDLSSTSPLLIAAAIQANIGQEFVMPTQGTTKPNFGTELRRLLEEAEWKPEDIAEKIGIDSRTVYRHLNGSVFPTAKTRWAYQGVLRERLKKNIVLPKSAKRQ
jgi:hypothetical protein